MNNDSAREPRNYPEQPPIIPHPIDGYQVEHERQQVPVLPRAGTATAKSQAPMISITHFIGPRRHSSWPSISPRRYFCTQCHVPQDDVKPLVEQRLRGHRHAAAAARRQPAMTGD